MGHNDHIDFDLLDLLTEAIDGGFLDEEEHASAIGVARKVVHEGYDTLSPKQRVLYDRVVGPALAACTRELEANSLRNRHGN